LNDELWFIKKENNNVNYEIWKSDGTVSGTNMVAQFSDSIYLVGVVDSKILVNSGSTLWMLEGPSYSPTQLLTIDSYPIHIFGGINTAPYRLTSVGSVLYGMMCVDSSCLDNATAGTGFEFYKYDISLPMSSNNPELIKEFTPGPNGTDIDKIIHSNNNVYFIPSLYAAKAWWVYEI